MELKKLDQALTVCKVASERDFDFKKDFYFAGKTDEEYSLVCITEDTPANINTDYILVKEENFDRALKALAAAGYDIV